MKENESKFDAALNKIHTVGKIIKILTAIAFIVVFVFIGIKLFPMISRNWEHKDTTQITINNKAYSAAMHHWSFGNYSDAESGLLTALKEVSNEYGDGDLRTAQVQQKLGALYIEMARYEDALEHLNPAYVTFQNELGNKDGKTIITKSQISVADVHLGNFEQGFRDLYEAYDECDILEYKVQIGQGIAQCYTEMGKYDEASEWYDKLEKLYVEMYGDSDSRNETLAVFWNDRAQLYADMGQADRAIECYDKAEKYWLKAHGITELTNTALEAKGDKELANIYINKAITLVEMTSNSEKAMECVNKALVICKERLGENNAETARCYSSISGVYNTLQDKKTEKQYLEKALDISLNTLGENSELTSSIYNSIGNLYLFDNEYETAIDYYEKSIEIRRNILSYDHLLTANTYLNISNAKNRLKDYEGAIEASKKGVEICEQLVGEDNMHTAEAYIELSRPLINTDRYDEAQSLLDKSKAICKKYSPDGSVTEAFTYQYQMKMLLRQEKYEEALPQGLTSLKIFQKVQGENHSNTADAMMFNGDVYSFLGDAENTGLYYSQAVKVYKNIFSPEIVHKALDERVRELIALESIDTHGLSYKEIKEKVTASAKNITNEQIKKRYALWGYDL